MTDMADRGTPGVDSDAQRTAVAVLVLISAPIAVLAYLWRDLSQPACALSWHGRALCRLTFAAAALDTTMCRSR